MLLHHHLRNWCRMHFWHCYLLAPHGANSTCVTHWLYSACSLESWACPLRLPTGPLWHHWCNTNFAHTLELMGSFTKWGTFTSFCPTTNVNANRTPTSTTNNAHVYLAKDTSIKAHHSWPLATTPVQPTCPWTQCHLTILTICPAWTISPTPKSFGSGHHWWCHWWNVGVATSFKAPWL